MADLWSPLSALGSAAAAAFAGVQIWLSRRDANRRATLSALERIDARLQPVWALDLPSLRTDILDCYGDGIGQLPDNASLYLTFLNSLDLLAFEAEEGLIDKKLAKQYAKTLLKEPVLSLTFLSQFQERCGDPNVYEHLRRFLTNATHAGHPLCRPDG